MLLASQKPKASATTHFLSRVCCSTFPLNSASFNSKGAFSDDLKGVTPVLLTLRARRGASVTFMSGSAPGQL